MSSTPIRTTQFAGASTLLAIVVLLVSLPTSAQPAESTAAAEGGDGAGESTHAEAQGGTPSAADVKEQCVRSFVAAQKLTQEGNLTAARAELVACGQDACPQVTKPLCVEWLREITLVLPSIIVTAKDVAGKDTLEVRVTVDGEVVANGLDGRPWPLDPGEHVLRFEHGKEKPIERTMVLAQGQRNRPVSVSFAHEVAPPPAPTQPNPATADEPGSPALLAVAYVGFSFAAAGIVAGTVTGILSLSESSTLEEDCPDQVCLPEAQSTLDTSYTLAHVSTASFIVAGVGATVGLTALLLSASDSNDEDETGFRVRPELGLGSLGVVGRF